ncbi:hypothetical protein ACUY4R_003829 [Kosakonia sp. BK9b]|uniref:hypothetical protein n=1 Tax=Kosakonia sp. TaxID=1916651 RepID=UPI00289C9F43|nr:hypothetical protein [Kosakonia sp.]
MANKNVGLQPLRVPAGWFIELNNFYEVEPVTENTDYFFSAVLISGENKRLGVSFDSRYEPEGMPGGEFVLVLQKQDYDRKGHITHVSVLDVKRTKQKAHFILQLEEFMQTGTV